MVIFLALLKSLEPNSRKNQNEKWKPQVKNRNLSRWKWNHNRKLNGCATKLWVSDFELTLDCLVGDGSHIITELVDWVSSGPTYTFNELRDILCGEAKHVLMQISCICLVLPTLEGNQRKFGPPGQLNWKVLISKNIPAA